ncbi:hypothetical protein BKA93DRAFT_38073 [Sparassis latifolia]
MSDLCQTSITISESGSDSRLRQESVFALSKPVEFNTTTNTTQTNHGVDILFSLNIHIHVHVHQAAVSAFKYDPPSLHLSSMKASHRNIVLSSNLRHLHPSHSISSSTPYTIINASHYPIHTIPTSTEASAVAHANIVQPSSSHSTNVHEDRIQAAPMPICGQPEVDSQEGQDNNEEGHDVQAGRQELWHELFGEKPEQTAENVGARDGMAKEILGAANRSMNVAEPVPLDKTSTKWPRKGGTPSKAKPIQGGPGARHAAGWAEKIIVFVRQVKIAAKTNGVHPPLDPSKISQILNDVDEAKHNLSRDTVKNSGIGKAIQHLAKCKPYATWNEKELKLVERAEGIEWYWRKCCKGKWAGVGRGSGRGL